MPRLSPVPDAPARALGLIRVSKERGEMISPEIQKVAIEDHCARLGYRVVDWVEALDDSGSQKRSPWWRKLDAVIERVESGDVQVIVGWKFSRTARNRLRWAVAIDRVETAGGRIESATEPLDVSTSAGRLARGMLAEFNAFEAERIGEVWKEVQKRRTSRGLPKDGKPRFGYEVVDGQFRPDPKTGPVLAALYRRYIAGESMHGLASWLNREGFTTVGGYSRHGPGRWHEVTLRANLDSGFGAGMLNVRGELLPGAHEPVIDEATWRQYLASRVARRPLKRVERSPYVLSGLMRCMCLVDGEPCGSTMSAGGYRTPDGKDRFTCNERRKFKTHPGGAVLMSYVERCVREWLADVAAEVSAEGQAVADRSPGVPRARRDAETLAREIAALDRQLVDLTVQLSRGVVPQRAYEAARDQIEGEKQLLEQRHAQEVLSARQVDAGPIAADLLRLWGVLSVEERRAILRSLIARVEVVTGRPRAAVRVIPRWSE